MLDIVTVKNLKAYYKTNSFGIRRTVKAVDDINLNIKKGESYGIAGESGCGKTTLLKVMMGAHKNPLMIDEGFVKFSFEKIEKVISKDAVDSLKWSELSYIPQGSMHVLNPVRKIKSTFHDFLLTNSKISKSDSYDISKSYIRDLGLSENVLQSYPHQLSGGMRQRVTIALSTILSPEIVFADEPTTALDVVVQKNVINLLKQIQSKKKCTIVLITHDLGVHANFSNVIGVLYAGKLVEESDKKTIINNPLHPYTKYLINSLPSFDSKKSIVTIPGRPPALDNPPEGCRFHLRCPIATAQCKKIEPQLVLKKENHKVACHNLN